MICLTIIAFYQDVVALIVPNTIRMPPMDHQCFLSNSKAHCNYANSGLYNRGDIKPAVYRNFSKVYKLLPKMRYKVKEICGDYYYEEMSLDEI